MKKLFTVVIVVALSYPMISVVAADQKFVGTYIYQYQLPIPDVPLTTGYMTLGKDGTVVLAEDDDFVAEETAFQGLWKKMGSKKFKFKTVGTSMASGEESICELSGFTAPCALVVEGTGLVNKNEFEFNFELAVCDNNFQNCTTYPDEVEALGCRVNFNSDIESCFDSY